MKKLRATIDPLQEKGKINRELYGQFIEQAGSCLLYTSRCV